MPSLVFNFVDKGSFKKRNCKKNNEFETTNTYPMSFHFMYNVHPFLASATSHSVNTVKASLTNKS